MSKLPNLGTESTPPARASSGRIARPELQLRGTLLFWLGLGLTIWGLLITAWSYVAASHGQVVLFGVGEAVGIVLLAIGVRIAILGRSGKAPDVCETLRKDLRKPILYLRGFKDDPLSERERVIGEGLQAPAALWTRTPEEELVRYFKGTGGMIALAQPDEIVPTRGATRTYLHHCAPEYQVRDGWKRWIEEKLAISQLAVLNWNPSPSKNLRWELSTAIATLGLANVLIWFPQPDDLEAFCQDPPAGLTCPAPSEDVLLLGFSNDGQPVIWETRSGPLRRAVTAGQPSTQERKEEADSDNMSGGRIARFFKRHLSTESDFGPRDRSDR